MEKIVKNRIARAFMRIDAVAPLVFTQDWRSSAARTQVKSHPQMDGTLSSHNRDTRIRDNTIGRDARWSKWLLRLLAMAFGFMATPAMADGLDVFRPQIPHFDAAGVDVTTGYLTFQMPLLSANPTNKGQMGLFYQFNSSTYTMSTNYSGALRLYIGDGDTTGAGYSITMSFGNDADDIEYYYSKNIYISRNHGSVKFYGANGTEIFMPSFSTGWSQYFTPATIIWTDTSGRQVRYVIEFPYSNLSPYDRFPGGGEYDIDSVTYPDGTTYKYNYETLHTNATVDPDQFRLLSITNNWGYQLKYEYLSDDPNMFNSAGTGRLAWVLSKITEVNSAYQYCNPLAEHCTLDSSWPKVTAGTDSVGAYLTNSTGGMYRYATTVSAHSATYQFQTPSSTTPNVLYSANWVGSYVVNNIDMYDDYSKRIASATINGKTWNYSYVDTWPVNSGGSIGDQPYAMKITSTDPLSNTHVYNDTSLATIDYMTDSWILLPVLSSDTDEINRTQSYGWQSDGQLNMLTKPENDKLVVSYDSSGNAVSQQYNAKPSAPATIQQRSIYPNPCTQPATCNKPNAQFDPNGNETDFTYMPFGGVASELDPGSSLNAPRRLRLYTYVQKSAAILNSSNALTSTNQPVWLVSTETDCQTTSGSNALVCDSAAPKKVTTYLYGADGTANNLLLRGTVVTADGTSLRTCYGYDKFSNKISETSPRAGLGVCS